MITVTWNNQALAAGLQRALADLTAARARIAELDSMLDRSCSAYQDDIERLNTRIAELEGWQRRAMPLIDDESCGCRKFIDSPLCDECEERARLIREATR